MFNGNQMSQRGNTDYHHNSNNLLNLQNNLLEVWTQKNVDNYYQTVYLSYLDTINDAKRLQKQVSKEIRLTYQGKSQFFIINDLLIKRQLVFSSLRQQIQQVQHRIGNSTENITERTLQHICNGIDQLRRFNLLCGQAIVNFQTSLFAPISSSETGIAGPSLQQIARQIDLNHPMFQIMNDDIDLLKKSFLKQYIVFRNSYDPFIMHPYQLVLKNNHFPNQNSKQVSKLFMMNISYAYRLLKTQHQILKFMSEGNHKQVNKERQKSQILSILGRKNKLQLQKDYTGNKQVRPTQTRLKGYEMNDFLQKKNKRGYDQQSQSLQQIYQKKTPQKDLLSSKSSNSVQMSPIKYRNQDKLKLPKIKIPKSNQKQKQNQVAQKIRKKQLVRPIALGSQIYQISPSRRQKSQPSKQKKQKLILMQQLKQLDIDNLTTPKRINSRDKSDSFIRNLGQHENKWNFIGLSQKVPFDFRQSQQTERKIKNYIKPKRLKDNLSQQIKRNSQFLNQPLQKDLIGSKIDNRRNNHNYSLPMSFSSKNPQNIPNKRIHLINNGQKKLDRPNFQRDSNEIAQQLNQSVSVNQSYQEQGIQEQQQDQESYFQAPQNKKKIFKVIYSKQESQYPQAEQFKNYQQNSQFPESPKKHYISGQTPDKAKNYVQHKLQNNSSPNHQNYRLKQKYWNSYQHTPSSSSKNTMEIPSNKNKHSDYQKPEKKISLFVQPKQNYNQEIQRQQTSVNQNKKRIMKIDNQYNIVCAKDKINIKQSHLNNKKQGYIYQDNKYDLSKQVKNIKSAQINNNQADISFCDNSNEHNNQNQTSFGYKQNQNKKGIDRQLSNQQKPNDKRQRQNKQQNLQPFSAKKQHSKPNIQQQQTDSRNQIANRSLDMSTDSNVLNRDKPVFQRQNQLKKQKQNYEKRKQFEKNNQGVSQEAKNNQKQMKYLPQKQFNSTQNKYKQLANKPSVPIYNKQKQQSNLNENKSQKNSQISPSKSQLKSLNVVVKPGKIDSNQLNQYLRNPKIDKKYKPYFETDSQEKWIQIMKQHTTFLTQFRIGTQLCAFGLCQPIPTSNSIMLRYWGFVSEVCSQQKSLLLFKKYIDYIQKYSTADSILYKGKPFDLIGETNFTECKKQIYQKKRSVQSKKSKPQYESFLSFEVSNIKFQEKKVQGNVQNIVSLYSDQIQAFSQQNSAGNKFMLQVNQQFVQMAIKNEKVKGIQQKVKYYKKIKQINEVNKILEDEQFDTYQVASDMNIQKIDLFMLKMNSPLKSNFCIQENYVKLPSQINNSASCKDREKFIYQIQFSDNKLKCYFASGKGYQSAQQFSKSIQRTVNKEANVKNGSKERVAIKMFSKQLYGQIKTQSLQSFGLYGNWEINFLYEAELHGKVKVSLEKCVMLGPQPFYMAIFIGEVFFAAIKVHEQDFIQ